MKIIKNLDEMYNALEELDFLNYREIKKSIKKYLKSNENDDNIRIIWCEHTCLEFRIIKSELNGVVSFENKNDKIVQFPNLDEFEDDDFNYIKIRVTKTKNELLKFRYYSILCNKFPHRDTAKMCVDLSWRLINDLEKEIYVQNFRISNFINLVLNSYAFSFKFNIKKERIKNKILELIFNEELWADNYYLVPYMFIQHVLDEKKNFKDLTGMDRVCWNIAKNLKEGKFYHSAIMVLELGEKVDFKLQNNVYEWRNEIGEIYEKMCDEEDDSKKPHFCTFAIENYRKAGNKSKIDELLNKYQIDYSQMFDFCGFSVKLEDYNDIINFINDFAEDLVENHDSEYILKYLTGDPNLMECHKNTLNFVKKSKNDTPLLRMLPTVLINPEGFIFERFEKDEERDNFAALDYYSNFIKSMYLPFLSRVVNLSIMKEKLSSKILLDYLTKKSWLGLEEIPILGENKFLSMIAPAINVFFEEWELMFLHDYNYPHFVLTIDSLISKIEGIIKLIYSLDKSIKEPTGKGTFQDKSLNRIFEDNNFDTLPEEDLFFLRYLLIEKAGLNLRNKVAHCLMKKSEYNEHNANLLILALLKLCAFNLVFEK